MTNRARLETRLAALGAVLAAQGIIQGESINIERQFTAGQSNPTYLLRAGTRNLVLRKQPDGHLLPKAHDVVREHRIMSALARAGFKVPASLFASEDRAIIGTAFVIMDYVPGDVHSSAALPDSQPGTRTAIYRSLAETLAALHRLPSDVLAEAGIQPRGNFIERQISVWRSAYLASMTEGDERVEFVGQRLLDTRPTDERMAVTHGDFRLENVIFQGAETAAVLDWELCTFGEPLADLAYCCLWYHFEPEMLNGLAGLNLAPLGIPTEREFLDVYLDSGGVEPHATHRYFLAFAFYRLAAILQGVYRRALDGNAASPEALARGGIARFCLEKAAAFIA
jgi:aminoglycoside phosphotransferase (APT) family kinase protein